LASYFPQHALTTIEMYRSFNSLHVDEIESRMTGLVPSGYSSNDAWRLAWQSLRQRRYRDKQIKNT
jgi:hypothetical protein